jgi:hypothetical protein
MGLLDKAKAVAEQAAVKAKEGVDDVQTKVALNQAYHELGKVAHELIESGEISHPRLEPATAKIKEQLAKAAPDGGASHEPANGDGAAG